MSSHSHSFGWIGPDELSKHALDAQQRHRAVIAECLGRMGVVSPEEGGAKVIPISIAVGASALSSAVEAPGLSLTA